MPTSLPPISALKRSHDGVQRLEAAAYGFSGANGGSAALPQLAVTLAQSAEESARCDARFDD